MEKFNATKNVEVNQADYFESEGNNELRAEFVEAKELLTLLKGLEGKSFKGKFELKKVEGPAKRLFELHSVLTANECYQLGLRPINDNFPPLAQAS